MKTIVITGPSGSSGDSLNTISINENSINVHDFIADETVQWSLINSFDSHHFSINSYVISLWE